MADGKVIIDTRLNKKGLENDVKSLTPVLKKLGGVLAAAFSVKALISFSQQAIELASDIQEVQNVVDTAFGDMAYKMEEFADTAIKTYGISKLTAKRTGSTLMAMASGMGIAKDEASDMALALTGLSADMSSFYNVSQDVAFTALKSVFTGETESLKQFGIVMTEANLESFALSQGIQKNIKDMTQAEKVQLRYAYIMEQTSLAQGDFAKTSSSWANQVRILKEQWKEFMSIIGSTLIQVLAPALQVLNRFVEALIRGATALANFFGVDLNTSNNASSATEDMTEGMDDYTEATEKATKAQNELLGGYDKLNVITPKQTASATAGAGSTILPSYGTGTKADQIVKSSEKISNSLKLLEGIDLSKLADALSNIKASLLAFGKNIGSGLKWLYDNILKPLAKWAITDAIPAFLNVLSGALDLINAVIETAKPILEWLWKNFLEPIARWTGGIIVDVLTDIADILKAISKNKGAVAVITGVIGALTAYKVGTSIGGVLGKLKDLNKALKEMSLLGKIGIAIGVAITGWEVGQKLYEWITGDKITQSITEQMADIWDAIKTGDIWGGLKLMMQDAWKGIKSLLKTIKDGVLSVVKAIWNGIKGIFNKTVIAFFKGIWEDIKGVFKDVGSWFKDAFATAKKNVEDAWKGIGTFFKNRWSDIKNAFSTAKDFLSETFRNAKSAVEGAWNNVGQFFKNRWNDISNAFSNVGNTLGSKFKNAWDEVKRAWDSFTTSNYFQHVWGGIKNAFGHVSDWFRDTFSDAWSKVRDVFSKGGKIFDGIKDGIADVLKTVINKIIGGINTVISKPFELLNKVLDKLRNFSIFGKKPFSGIPSIPIPQIPRLASGGVIPPNKEFLAILGDQKHGTNIETPLSTMIEAFNKALDLRSGQDTDKDINLYVDGDKLFNWTIKKNNEYKNRYGKPAY